MNQTGLGAVLTLRASALRASLQTLPWGEFVELAAVLTHRDTKQKRHLGAGLCS